MRAIDLRGKRALVLGVANRRSLAWAIADALAAAGCRLALAYQNERLRENVEALASAHEGSLLAPCDVTEPEQVRALFETLERAWGALDILVHSVAYAPRQELEGQFLQTSLEGWRTAMEVSAYSLLATAREAVRLMGEEGGSILALTFLASERVFPNYNVMGSAKAALEHIVRQLAFELGPRQVRVNAISAGPVATLSARGIAGFTQMLAHHRERAPLRRNIEPREVGDTALFLCSPLASGITGSVIFVDAGYHIMGI